MVLVSSHVCTLEVGQGGLAAVVLRLRELRSAVVRPAALLHEAATLPGVAALVPSVLLVEEEVGTEDGLPRYGAHLGLSL